MVLAVFPPITHWNGMPMTSTPPFDDANTLESQDEALAMTALREYADHALQDPARAAFKQRLLDDAEFYGAALTALKQVADLLFYAGSFGDDDDVFELNKVEKAFRASVRPDPVEIRAMRDYFLVHHEALRMAVYLTPDETARYKQRIQTFLASYRERVALLSDA